ncbi:MAG: hypothetical protein ACI4XM_02805 [Candidatus Coprovivens sp.]
MKELLLLKDRVDNLYKKGVDGEQDVFDELDYLILSILKYDDLSMYSDEETEQITSMMDLFIEKINLIYDLLEVNRDNLLTISKLKEELSKLEMKRFNIVNNYVMGIVTIDDINSFKNELFSFRDKLYAILISDNNLLEIAKMKSKVQHFNTEVLEDEDILKQAYDNKS